jgi:iron complex outermembrane receptor protein
LENNTLLEKQKSNEIRNQLNAYLSFETKLLSKLILSASGNINSTRYAVSDLFTTDEVDYSGNYFNKLIFSPKIGLNYRHNSNLSFYASVGHGFSNPTAEESLTSQGFLNSALRPEQGWTIDIGARGTAFANTLSYEVSAYAITLNDLLVTKRISEEIFYGENAGRSTLKGIELQLKYKPATYFQTLVSFSKSDNKFKEFISDNVNYANKQLPGIPNLNATVDMQSVPFKNLQLNAIYTYSGAQFLNDANSKQSNAWQTVNFRAGYRLAVFRNHKVQLIATINNLFDEKYASMILVNAPSFGSRPPRYYYPALPRNFLITLKIN